MGRVGDTALEIMMSSPPRAEIVSFTVRWQSASRPISCECQSRGGEQNVDGSWEGSGWELTPRIRKAFMPCSFSILAATFWARSALAL